MRHARVWAVGVLLVPLMVLSNAGLAQEDESAETSEEERVRDARQVLRDAIDEHLPWWMPKGREESKNRLVPESEFNLDVERGERLSLDQVVLQVRRSHDGRVVRATETDDGFVVRLLLDGGRLRTLHISPQGEVVDAQLDDR